MSLISGIEALTLKKTVQTTNSKEVKGHIDGAMEINVELTFLSLEIFKHTNI